jgi:hypothetical protein
MNTLLTTDESELIRLKTAEKLVWRDVEYTKDGYLVGHGPGRRDLKVVPSYARDIRAAWEIIEELTTSGADVRIGNRRKGIREYYVEIHCTGLPVARGVHELVSMAICMAFLDYKGSRT